jgi:AraC-like DNA-binding protein
VADPTTHHPHTAPLPRLVTICTDVWPEPDRVAMFRDTFGGDGVRVEPSPEEPLRINVTLMKLPGLGLLWGSRSALRSDFADGHDRLMFSLGRDALAKQFGREIVLEPGDAVALSGADLGSLTTSRAGPIATLDFPHGVLAPLLKDVSTSCGRRIPSNLPALRLLRGYLSALQESDGMSAFGLQRLAITHIYDLAALALGATREAEEIARGRGMRVARLQAIKADILGNLDREVSVGHIAAQHRLSPRYIRMLFENEGTSFTEFVREERLKRAHSKLLSHRFDHLRISDIAYEVGFNDLSYFIRAFRRRFGYPPREVRELRRAGS